MLVFIVVCIIVAVLCFRMAVKTSKASKAEKQEQNKLKESLSTKTCKTFRVVGVTFDNVDGSSRQEILEETFECHPVDRCILVPYLYEGEDAISVQNCYDEIVGNISKNDVARVRSLMDKNYYAELEIFDFYDDDDRQMFSADVNIYY